MAVRETPDRSPASHGIAVVKAAYMSAREALKECRRCRLDAPCAVVAEG